ncbi:T9SS type A sorting domain-containing protein, partial [candidate division WOR-3 bacterium]|nr:T9SS type A sorting domain-containing protein [candidate division WOR-3 bacterium]
GYAVGAVPDSMGGRGGLIIKTTDGGDAWVVQLRDPLGGALRSVYLIDNDIGYAVGEAGSAFVTTDGGANWTPMMVGGTDMLTYVSFPENGQTGFIGVYPRISAVRVYMTTDGGTTWLSISVGGGDDWSTGCAVANDSTGIVFGLSGFVYGWPSGQYQDPQAPGCSLVAASYSKSENNRAYLVGNDTALGVGVVRYTATGGYPKWDSVTCPPLPLSCVDYASAEVAFVGGSHGFIGRTYSTYEIRATDDPGVTATITSICFPNGPDTGYAAAGTHILKTTDAGGVAEARPPIAARSGIRLVSNPCRCGISFSSDVETDVLVFDALGRVVARQTAAKGLNFLPLSKSGVYVVRSTTGGHAASQKVVVER